MPFASDNGEVSSDSPGLVPPGRGLRGGSQTASGSRYVCGVFLSRRFLATVRGKWRGKSSAPQTQTLELCWLSFGGRQTDRGMRCQVGCMGSQQLTAETIKRMRLSRGPALPEESTSAGPNLRPPSLALPSSSFCFFSPPPSPPYLQSGDGFSRGPRRNPPSIL